jgi:hypothetical protein
MKFAIASAALPKRGRSNQVTLSLKRNPCRSSYVLLARADSSLTKAEEYYYGQNPSQPRPTRQFDVYNASRARLRGDFWPGAPGAVVFESFLRVKRALWYPWCFLWCFWCVLVCFWCVLGCFIVVLVRLARRCVVRFARAAAWFFLAWRPRFQKTS